MVFGLPTKSKRNPASFFRTAFGHVYKNGPYHGLQRNLLVPQHRWHVTPWLVRGVKLCFIETAIFYRSTLQGLHWHLTNNNNYLVGKKIQGHFTHEIESPWPLHFKHSHWWKRRSQSKFAFHYAWGTNGVCECKMDVKCTWIPTWHQMTMFHDHLDYFHTKPPLGGRSNTKSGDHCTPNAHNRWLILFYHVWGPRMNRHSLK